MPNETYLEDDRPISAERSLAVHRRQILIVSVVYKSERGHVDGDSVDDDKAVVKVRSGASAATMVVKELFWGQLDHGSCHIPVRLKDR